MKTKVLISTALLGSSLGSFAFAADVHELRSNSATSTFGEAAEGILIQPLSISLVNTLVFPDLVIPAAVDVSHSVTVGGTVDSVALSYSSDDAKPNGQTGIVDPTAAGSLGAPRFGKIAISGHKDKAIKVLVTSGSTGGGQGASGYTITPNKISDYTNAASPYGTVLDTTGTKTIEFGGMLEAWSNATAGRVTESITVTVNYY